MKRILEMKTLGLFFIGLALCCNGFAQEIHIPDSTLAELEKMLSDTVVVAKKHNITKTALVLVGDVISNQHYTRSRLYAPDFTTEFRKAKTPKNAEDDRLMRDTGVGKELPE